MRPETCSGHAPEVEEGKEVDIPRDAEFLYVPVGTDAHCGRRKPFRQMRSNVQRSDIQFEIVGDETDTGTEGEGTDAARVDTETECDVVEKFDLRTETELRAGGVARDIIEALPVREGEVPIAVLLRYIGDGDNTGENHGRRERG